MSTARPWSTCAATPSPSPRPRMRAAMMAAPLGDDVFGDDPSVNALQEKIAAHAGLRGGAVRADRHAEQPLRDPVALPARRRIHRRPAWRTATAGKAAAPRCSAACSRSRWTTSPTARWRWPTSRPPSSPTMRTSRARGCWRWRTRWAASCCPSATSSRRRSWRKRKGLARHLDGARLFNAAVAQAAQTRHRRARRSAPHRAVLRQRLGLLQQGPGRAGRLGAVRLARVHRARAPHPQDGRRRHAAGRRAGGGGFACARPPRRAPGARTMRWRAGWPTAWPASTACRSRRRRPTSLFVDLTGAAQARSAELLAHLKQHGVLATGPVPPALRRPIWMSMRPASTAPSRAIRGFFQA